MLIDPKDKQSTFSPVLIKNLILLFTAQNIAQK